MADLLGSLLPTDYAAPDVQDVLGGELLGSTCNNDGTTPTCSSPSTCGLFGGKPGG